MDARWIVVRQSSLSSIGTLSPWSQCEALSPGQNAGHAMGTHNKRTEWQQAPGKGTKEHLGREKRGRMLGAQEMQPPRWQVRLSSFSVTSLLQETQLSKELIGKYA